MRPVDYLFKNVFLTLLFSCVSVGLVACDGSESGAGSTNPSDDGSSIRVVGVASEGGSVLPSEQYVPVNTAAVFQIQPNSNRKIGSIVGCPGMQNGDRYTTLQLNEPCTLVVNFIRTDDPVSIDIFGKGVVTADQNVCTGATAPCTWFENAGMELLIEAEPEPGWEFSHWSGCKTAVDRICSVMELSNPKVTAYFAQPGDIELQPDVIVLSETHLNALTNISQDALIFDNTVDDLSQLPIGTVLVSTRDAGFARRISQIISVPNSYLIVQTRQATAEDVVQSGTVIWSSTNLDSRNIEFIPSLQNKVVVSSNPSLSQVYTVDIPIHSGINPETGAKVEMKLTGEVAIDLNTDFAIDFGFGNLDELKIAHSIKTESSLTLSAGAVKKIPLFERKVPFGTFRIGPVVAGPLVLFIDIETYVNVDAEVEGKFEVKTQVTRSSVNGFHYRKNSGWVNLRQKPSTDWDPVVIDAPEASVDTALWLNARVSAKLWDLAGPLLKTGPVLSAEATYDLGETPDIYDTCLSASVYLGSKSELAGVFGFYGWTISTPKYTHKSQRVKIYDNKDFLDSEQCDAELPAAPTDLIVTEVGSSLELAWEPGMGSTIADYLVFRDGVYLDQAFGNTYVDEINKRDSRMCYEVSAISATGLVSNSSNVACVTPVTASRQPPRTPQNFIVADVTTNSVQLEWDNGAVSAEDISYLVVDSSRDIVLERTINLEVLVNRLQSNTDYCFSVVAVNQFGDQSLPSQELCVRTAPLDQGQWRASVRCEDEVDYAFDSLLDIGASTNGIVSSSGTARDYADGVAGAGQSFAYILSGLYDNETKLLNGTLSFTFESGTYRQDEFELNLTGDDSGDVSATLVEHTSFGCDVAIRLQRVQPSATNLVEPLARVRTTSSLARIMGE